MWTTILLWPSELWISTWGPKKGLHLFMFRLKFGVLDLQWPSISDQKLCLWENSKCFAKGAATLYVACFKFQSATRTSTKLHAQPKQRFYDLFVEWRWTASTTIKVKRTNLTDKTASRKKLRWRNKVGSMPWVLFDCKTLLLFTQKLSKRQRMTNQHELAHESLVGWEQALWIRFQAEAESAPLVYQTLPSASNSIPSMKMPSICGQTILYGPPLFRKLQGIHLEWPSISDQKLCLWENSKCFATKPGAATLYVACFKFQSATRTSTKLHAQPRQGFYDLFVEWRWVASTTIKVKRTNLTDKTASRKKLRWRNKVGSMPWVLFDCKTLLPFTQELSKKQRMANQHGR